jgi:hypothetical protein
MLIRSITMPWWIRWLRASVLLLAGYCAFAFDLWKQSPGRLPFWVVALVIVAPIASAALVAAVWTMRFKPYTDIVAELTVEQRAELDSILKPGPLPTDPKVLAAAARLRWLARAHLGRRLLRKSWAIVMVGVAYGALVIAVLGMAATGAFVITGMVILAARLGWGQIRGRRLAPRWAALVAAAESDPAAQALLRMATDAPPRRDWRRRVCVVGAVVIYVGAFIAIFAGIISAHFAECYDLADTVADYINDHAELLDGSSLTDTAPPSASYREWAAQLAIYASNSPTSSLGSDLARISDLADRITRNVEQLRQSGTGTTRIDPQQIAQFDSLVSELIDAGQPLATVCS